MLTTAASSMSDQMMLPGICGATSLLESPASMPRCACSAGRPTPKSGPAARPAKTPALRRRFTERVAAYRASAAVSRMFGSILSPLAVRGDSSSRMFQGSGRGLPKSRDVWNSLATAYANPNARLRVLARLMHEGACSLLPTLTARDFRSPGRRDHPRRHGARGQPLPEIFGERLSPAFGAWMMGFPPEWLSCAPSATPSSPTKPPQQSPTAGQREDFEPQAELHG